MPNLRLPPGPKYYQLFKASEIQKAPVEMFVEMWKTYGDIIHLPIMPKYRMMLFSHPRHAEHILGNHSDRYLKPEILLKNMGLVQGKGLFTSEGAEWQRHRRMMQPAFHQKYLNRLHSMMVSCVDQMLEEWSNHGTGIPINIAAEMTQLTLKIVSLTLFSVDLSEQSNQLGQACRFAFDYVYGRMANPLSPPVSLPTPNNRKFRQAKQTIDQIVQGFIQERRGQTVQPLDLLTLLLEAQDPEMDCSKNRESQFSDRQLQDEVITLINAGHETSATAMAWLWMFLGERPDVLSQLQTEIDHVLGTETIQAKHLSQLTYTQQVIDESLRLKHPGLALMRTAQEEDEIDGYRIPKGSNCLILNTHIFQHPDFWDEPTEFMPERFAPELKAQRHKYAYFPFGAGPHICIGKNMALMELVIILASIIQRFEVRLCPGQTFDIDPRFTLKPRHGVQVTLHPRA